MTFPVTIIGGVVVWKGGMNIDADGAPNAYCEPNVGIGLDYLANAGGPGNWYGIVTNGMGEPVVQTADQPCPGFYISQTALVDHTKTLVDPTRYVDSTSVPYVTCTRDMRSRGVMLGDLAWVLYRQQQYGALVADVGPKPGEGSILLAQALGIPSSPKHGGADDGVAFLIFPKTATGWPRDLDEIQQSARLLFEKWGGVDKLESLLTAPPAA
jgi:hypothetical protein